MTCKSCNQELRTDEQGIKPALIRDEIAFTDTTHILTCDNSECALCGYTFTRERYTEENLVKYMEVQ